MVLAYGLNICVTENSREYDDVFQHYPKKAGRKRPLRLVCPPTPSGL